MSAHLTRICVERVLPEHKDYYDSIKHDSRLAAAFWSSKLWPQNSTITIGFLDEPTNQNQRTPMAIMEKIGRNIDPLQKSLAKVPLKKALKTIVEKRIQPLVNLKLKFIDNNPKDADIRISFKDANASWSLVGTDSAKKSAKNCKGKHCGDPSMNLGWFDVGTYIHEFGHALGMVHEHQNPRGEDIEWDLPKLYTYMEETQGWDKQQVNTNVVNRYKLSQINGSKFDPLSVMLYFFPASLTKNDKGTRQNFSLSGIDAEWISKSYPGGPMTPQDFYQKAYGKSLESSISQSEKIRHEMTTSNSHIWVILITIFIVAILTGGILFWLLRKHK